MFAIDHAATALILRRRFPRQPMGWLLLSVQLMELVWVGLNYAGVERTTTEAVVRSVADVHLSYMPFSHSVASIVLVAAVAWFICARVLGRPELGLAVGLGVVSHLVLDLLTHAPDVALAPGIESPKLGLGLYATFPLGAFALELGYGIFCWWIYRGGRALLAVIVFFNLGDLSLFSAAIPGPEGRLAGRPMVLVTVILAQIVATLLLVGWLAGRGKEAGSAGRAGPTLEG
jgi:membrane-bound metal-dependent hydrolase YbcI (DUF457 family)